MPMDEMKYGYLFVQSGYEERAIRYIERYLMDYEATGLEKIQYRSREGVRTQERNRLMPGYVFFRTVTELEESELRQVTGYVRLLCYESGCWQLYGADEAFARYVFEKDGLLGVSTACKVGDEIRLIDGPLKDHEGSILKMDRHRKNGLVALRCQGRVFQVWLPFDVISPRTERKMDEN